MNKALVLVCLSMIALGSLVVYAAAPLIATLTLHGTVLVAGAGLEATDLAGNPISTINWGSIIRNVVVPQSIRIKNVGDLPCTLSMIHTLQATDGTLTWDSEGVGIPVDDSVLVVFSLAMYLPEGSNFNFDIVVTGTS